MKVRHYMHKLNDEMYAEITRIIEDKIDMNEKVNKYDVLKEARENLGQTVRYRDVRDQIDEIIRYVAKERGKCWSSEYVRTSDGKVYREYTFYFDDFSDEYENEPDDDSDEYEASIDEDGIEYYAMTDAYGRIYLSKPMRESLGLDRIDNAIERDSDNRRIILNGSDDAAENYIDLSYHSQIFVANTLGISAYNKVKIYVGQDDEVIIEPA